MPGARKVAYIAIVWCVMIPLARAQEAVTIIQLPGGKSLQLTFTTIDVPGAGVTSVSGINTAGEMVGVYGITNTSPSHGFVIQGGNLTSFDYPGAESTVGSSVNDSGLIVGYAEFNGGLVVHGFLYDGQTFTTFDVPRQPQTYPSGINNAGDVVGTAGFSGSSTKAFEMSNGHFKLIRIPGTDLGKVASGINNFGEIAGFTDSSAFIYKGGKLKPVAFPRAQQTLAWDVNDQRVVVGWYGVGTHSHGFALINGQYMSFDYPGAKGTFARGINSLGQIVGEYTFDFVAYHGFVTSPITAAGVQ